MTFCANKFIARTTNDDYENLAARIIEHMRATAEWGEFFPSGLLGTGYQESIAMCQYPLTCEEALAKGFTRCEYQAPQPQVARVVESSILPDSIQEVDDSIVEDGLKCSHSGKLFRIVSRELEYYRRHSIPIPRVHPYERYRLRVKERGPRTLRACTCNQCGAELSTCCQPQEIRPIFCQVCFDSRVY